MSFSSFMSSLFLHRCRRFSLKWEYFQSVRSFHKNKSLHIISWVKYLLNMHVKRRAFLVESFVESKFFYSRRRSRARFDENEWTFKTYKYKTLYMSDQAFYMWNLLYISKSSDERSSFIIVEYIDFNKNSWSWTFVSRQKKKFWDRDPLFSDSTLRLSDAKTASRLAHIGLAYHASWGMRIAYPRSKKARLDKSEGLSTEVSAQSFTNRSHRVY
jgi:hypothetical protein